MGGSCSYGGGASGCGCGCYGGVEGTPYGIRNSATSLEQCLLDHGLDGLDHRIDLDLPPWKDALGALATGPVVK